MRRILFILSVIAVLASCTERKVYDHYDHTPLSGWDRVDELSYEVPAIADSGRYVTTLGLRINETYPFQALTLIVKHDIYNKVGAKNKPKIIKSFSDTVNCVLFDNKGTIKGNGISYFQYHYRISEEELKQGDSLHVSVRHGMRREIIPGISDIGISVTRQK